MSESEEQKDDQSMVVAESSKSTGEGNEAQKKGIEFLGFLILLFLFGNLIYTWGKPIIVAIIGHK